MMHKKEHNLIRMNPQGDPVYPVKAPGSDQVFHVFRETATLYDILSDRGDQIVTLPWAVRIQTTACQLEALGLTDFLGAPALMHHLVRLARSGRSGMAIIQYMTALESEARYEAKRRFACG